MKAPESALFSIARLETYRHDRKAHVTSKLAMATGFFYKTKHDGNEKIFLITNKHVVFDKKEHYFPDKLSLYVHSDSHHLSKVKKIDLQLWDKSGKRLWKYSRIHSTVDVVALEVKQESLDNCFYLTFSKADILSDDINLAGKDIDLGMQLLVLGYPLDFYDEMNHFPITRTACVATWPWFNFNREPCFLIDARLHHGMSGSPVLSSPGSIHKTVKPSNQKVIKTEQDVFLLGVFSAEWHMRGEPLGLNVVWHANIIEEIVSSAV